MKRIMFLLSAIVVITFASCGNSTSIKKQEVSTHTESDYLSDHIFTVVNFEGISGSGLQLVTVSENDQQNTLFYVLCPVNRPMTINKQVRLQRIEFNVSNPNMPHFSLMIK